MEISQEQAILEAVLFAAGEPVSAARLAQITGSEEKTVRTLLRDMADQYEKENRGICIVEIEKSFQMSTNPRYYDWVKQLFQSAEKKTLSQTLLETLAIIAYRQPVTKGQIEEIRGVSADHAVNRLVEYGLVTEKGRMDAPGKPILFGTTDEFLRHFGYKSLKQLPTPGEAAEEEAAFEQIGLQSKP